MAYRRRYELKITPLKIVGNNVVDAGPATIITDPLTIRFNVNKMIYAGANISANIQIYNLNKTTRDHIFYDWLQIDDLRKVELSAGYYGGKFGLIYRGVIRSCRPKKERTDVVMEIEAQSGLFVLDNEISLCLDSGESNKEVVGTIVEKTAILEQGEQAIVEKYFPRTVSLLGPAALILKTYSNEKGFVDNERYLILDPNDAVEGDVRVIDDETGLLGIPERDRTTVKVTCMFEPRIKLGEIIQIKSRIADVFDGQYKVWGISHSGVIGDAASGTLTTTLTLYTGEQVFGYFKTGRTSWNVVGGGNGKS